MMTDAEEYYASLDAALRAAMRGDDEPLIRHAEQYGIMYSNQSVPTQMAFPGEGKPKFYKHRWPPDGDGPYGMEEVEEPTERG